MGDSGFNPFKEGEKSEVESISLTDLFEELCPVYMAYGMTYDEYWYGEPYRAKFYRECYELQFKKKDEECWMQGMYIYDALCRVSPILHAFSKSGTKPLPYPEKPYMLELAKETSEQEKEKQAENERLIAQVHFNAWARSTAKQFNKNNNN